MDRAFTASYWRSAPLRHRCKEFWRNRRHFQPDFLCGLVPALLLVIATFVSAQFWPAPPPPAQDLFVNIEMVAKGRRASELRGSDVLNERQKRIGTIEDIIIDRKHALHAVLRFQGLQGSQARLVTNPFSVVELNEADEN